MRVKRLFESYDSRQYGIPWGAKITFNGTEPVYNFIGEFLGDPRTGSAGIVAIEAETNDIVAFGQKDNDWDKTAQYWYVVSKTGTLLKTTHQAALNRQVAMIIDALKKLQKEHDILHDDYRKLNKAYVTLKNERDE